METGRGQNQESVGESNSDNPKSHKPGKNKTILGGQPGGAGEQENQKPQADGLGTGQRQSQDPLWVYNEDLQQ